jgi:MFS family permease
MRRRPREDAGVRLRRPSGGLWSHADFLRLWTGQTISELGSQVSGLAIPWVAAVVLHVRPFLFSLLGVVGVLPFILIALPAGVWVDRLRRRPILIAGDAARAALLVTIPISYAFGVLTIWQLLATSFVVGIFTVFFDIAYMSYVPAIVGRADLVDGNAKLDLTVSVAQVAGPSIAGALIGAITAPYAVAVDAVSFVASAGFVMRMRHREVLPERTEAEPKPAMVREVMEGLRFLVGHRWLRPIAACTGSANFFLSLTFSILLLYLTRSLHLSSLEVGAVFAVGSIGSVTAALVSSRLQRAIGVGRTIALTPLLGVAFFAFPLAPRAFPLPVLMLGELLFGFNVVAYNVAQRSLRQAITPDRLLGRTNAAMRWLVWGTMPLGTLAGGGIATVFSLRAALWTGAVGMLFPAVPVLLSSVRSIREMPEPETPAGHVPTVVSPITPVVVEPNV